ncbi:MAG: archease [Candidatus Pacearchaeota archaeon]|jgi:SHS2 domain-containing protein
MKTFEFLEHTADIKIKAYGKDINEVFKNSAYAFLNFLTNKKISEKKLKKIKVQGKDFESLLYNFIEELIFLLDSENLLISKIKKLKIDKNKFKLESEIYFDKCEKYLIRKSIKAITYNEMYIKKQKDKWIAQFVLDI